MAREEQAAIWFEPPCYVLLLMMTELEEVVVHVRTNTSRELSSCTCSALGMMEAGAALTAVKVENAAK